MSSWIGRASFVGMVTFAMAMALEVPLSATISVVPEIDGGTLSAGMALLATGVLIVRARRRSK